MAKQKAVKVDTQQLAKGVFTPSNSDDAVTVVTPLEELTDKDKEDLEDFASFVLNMRTAKKPRVRCGSRR